MVSADSFQINRTVNSYGEVEAAENLLSGTGAFSYDLTRNNRDRITAKSEQIEGTSNQFAYTYDNIGRLLTVARNGLPVEEFRYDDNGNRTYEMNTLRGIVGRTFTHSIEDHTLTAGPISYEFDYDDNLAARREGTEITQYLYSSTGELQRVTLPDNTLIEYINDPLGRRIVKKVNGAIEERYLWLNQTTLLAVYDGSGNMLQRFEYADDRVPYAMTKGGTIYFLAFDQVGSLRLITDNVGTTVKRIDYDSFGNIISDSNPSFTIPFGFAGGHHDRDTKLVRFGYRDYMPEIGNWTAKDPILFAGGDSNLYGYVSNDPVNWVDHWGLLGEVITFQPVGWGASSFGHTAYNDNGTVYSFGPNGMWNGSFEDYMKKNDFREAVGAVFDLTPQQEDKLRKCLDKSAGGYGNLSNNCGDPLEKCLEELGFNLGANLFPVGLGEALDDGGYVKQYNFYPRNPDLADPKPGSSAPWAK